MGVMKVADLVEALLKCDQNLPVFTRMWNDRGPGDDYFKVEALWGGGTSVEDVSYDIPHIGGIYGKAVVLGELPDDDE